MSAFQRTFEVFEISCSQNEQNHSQRTRKITDNPSISTIYGKQPPTRTPSIFDFGLCQNDGICDAGLPDSGMRNTLPIVCTRQYPVITGVLRIGCESRVT